MMELKEKVSDIDTLDHVGIMYLKLFGIGIKEVEALLLLLN